MLDHNKLEKTEFIPPTWSNSSYKLSYVKLFIKNVE